MDSRRRQEPSELASGVEYARLHRAERAIEVVSNVAIIVLAVIVAAVALRNYVFTPRANLELPQGTKFELPDVRWSERPHTLVMVLAKDCQYCSASAEFYRRLIEETARLRVPVIAA